MSTRLADMRRYRKPLFRKMLIANIGLSVIPILLLGITLFYISFNNIRENAIASATEMILKMESDINGLMGDVVTLGNMVAQDNQLQIMLRKELPADRKTQYSEKLTMNAHLYYLGSFYDQIYGFCVIGENQSTLTSGIAPYRNKDFYSETWYKDVKESSNQGIWFPPHVGSFDLLSAQKELVTFGIPILDRLSGKAMGVVMLDMETALLNDIFESSYMKLGVKILDEDYNILFSNGEEPLQEQNIIKNSVQEGKPITPGQWLFDQMNGYYYKSLNNGWILQFTLDNSDIYASSQRMIPFMIVLMLILIIIAAICSVMQARKFYVPVESLKETMQSVEDGNLKVRVKLNTQDELHELGDNFNRMLDRIDVFMRRDRKTQEELRKAELRVLQSQINPHFLYNTLDSINWMSRSGENDKVEQMINALTLLFRTSLSKGEDFISVDSELTNATSYLQIQKIRYASKLKYEINVPPSLHGYRIVKIILQPILENAIYHGIKEKDGGGTVIVSARENDDTLEFSIYDDGVGIPEPQLQQIRNMLEAGEKQLAKSYGMYFVQRRIQIYYGSNYGITIDSEYGKGTMVKITIPKVGEKSNDTNSHY